MSDQKLEKCPFCGKEPKCDKYQTMTSVVWDTMVDVYLVVCKCGASVQSFNNNEEAIKAWNTRSGVRVPSVEEIKKVLQDFRIAKNPDDLGESKILIVKDVDLKVGVVQGLGKDTINELSNAIHNLLTARQKERG